MIDLPLDEQSRTALRMKLLEEYVIRAHEKAGRHLRSAKCINGNHRCTNSGATCLCICHDRKRSRWEVADGAER